MNSGRGDIMPPSIKLNKIIDNLQLSILVEGNLETDIKGGYTGDLLSDVMVNSDASQIWVTIQTHINIIAIAILKELTVIILTQGKNPDPETVEKVKTEKVTILSTPLPKLEIVGRLYQVGIKGI